MHYSAWNTKGMKISMLKFIHEESSDRAFEEEVMLSGFANAQVKGEGSGVSFDEAQETFTARYTHETVALAFAITEEAIEDNLYDRLASRYTKALARSMSNAKQVKAVEPSNSRSSYYGWFDSGDGVALFNYTTQQWLELLLIL